MTSNLSLEIFRAFLFGFLFNAKLELKRSFSYLTKDLIFCPIKS